MRPLDNAGVGIARGIAALQGAAGRIATRSAQPSSTAGDEVSDVVTLSTSVAQVRANVAVARADQETQKALLDMFA